jgi:glycosyltransferase involved in cell wall biosynthesis
VKALMTADAAGGVWTYALTLAEALAPHGVELVLATMGRLPDVRQRRAAARHPNVTLATSTYKLEWMDSPWSDVHAAGEWLLELESLVKPDVVHLNGYAHAALPWTSPTVLVAHSCVLSWWRAVLGAEAPPAWNRYRTALREGVNAATIVIAPTRAVLTDLERECGALSSARVIPNGSDPERYWVAPKESFILAAGRLWDEAKNVAALDRAAPNVRWPIYIVGDRRHPDGTTRVYTHARVLDAMAPEVLGAWMASAAIYALPARYEPFGLSVLEAAFSGCALVLGDIESLRENWTGAAAFVPPEDEQALAAVLTDLAGDPVRRVQLARGAVTRARARFGLARQGTAYLTAYQEAQRAHAGVAVCA